MPCGGCGGGDVKIAPKRLTTTIPNRTSPSVQKELRPKPIQRMASPLKPRTQIKVRPLELVKVARSRARDIRLCPVCGASLSIEITGRTRRKRFRCIRCQKTYT